MRIAESLADLRAARSTMAGRVGLVPTMGALHEGHLALVRAARTDNDAVIVTIFVNPTQFAADEDLASYPRDLERDLALLRAEGVDLVFTPTPVLMYPPGYRTYVSVEALSGVLEGARRPGHFRGVTTVVAKLFHLTAPERAYFGQKDAQQVIILRQMVRDLNFPLDVVVYPTVRETDGLALSSRNAYLQPEPRAAARVLYRALQAASAAYDAGERHPNALRQAALDVLAGEPLALVDYVAVNDPHTLLDLHTPTEEPLLLSMAVQVGTPHLLDNALLPWSLNNRDDLTRILGGHV